MLSPKRDTFIDNSQLKELLALKQQQAGVIEAREAVKQATATLEQGKSIMLFTIVTIVFVSNHYLSIEDGTLIRLLFFQLPLSFCASLFGMNTAEFNGSILSLTQQFTYMCMLLFPSFQFHQYSKVTNPYVDNSSNFCW